MPERTLDDWLQVLCTSTRVIGKNRARLCMNLRAWLQQTITAVSSFFQVAPGRPCSRGLSGIGEGSVKGLMRGVLGWLTNTHDYC
jgi:hypothetical protein